MTRETSGGGSAASCLYQSWELWVKTVKMRHWAANKEAAECVGSQRSAVWSRSAALFMFAGLMAAI